MVNISKWDKVMFYSVRKVDWTLLYHKECIARSDSFFDKNQKDYVVFLEWVWWFVMVSHCEILEKFDK